MVIQADFTPFCWNNCVWWYSFIWGWGLLEAFLGVAEFHSKVGRFAWQQTCVVRRGIRTSDVPWYRLISVLINAQFNPEVPIEELRFEHNRKAVSGPLWQWMLHPINKVCAICQCPTPLKLWISKVSGCYATAFDWCEREHRSRTTSGRKKQIIMYSDVQTWTILVSKHSVLKFACLIWTHRAQQAHFASELVPYCCLRLEIHQKKITHFRVIALERFGSRCFVTTFGDWWHMYWIKTRDPPPPQKKKQQTKQQNVTPRCRMQCGATRVSPNRAWISRHFSRMTRTLARLCVCVRGWLLKHVRAAGSFAQKHGQNVAFGFPQHKRKRIVLAAKCKHAHPFHLSTSYFNNSQNNSPQTVYAFPEIFRCNRKWSQKALSLVPSLRKPDYGSQLHWQHQFGHIASWRFCKLLPEQNWLARAKLSTNLLGSAIISWQDVGWPVHLCLHEVGWIPMLPNARVFVHEIYDGMYVFMMTR